jgi:hypothetical protein
VLHVIGIAFDGEMLEYANTQLFQPGSLFMTSASMNFAMPCFTLSRLTICPPKRGRVAPPLLCV